MTTDGQLIERLHFKDPTALELIYDQYHPLLWNICSREFADPVICERILSGIFQKLWQKPQKFSGERRLLFYLIICLKEDIHIEKQALCGLRGEKTCS
ncbi:RNA polymerase sigma factor [Planococcus dechangensis]|uniref:RNA polymerase sigma factor n=1 Tax=Planococcus dechangensis TaxID=1176255 RepID=A0ABV9MCI8_9BACL